MPIITLTTERLILRPWRDSDLEPYAALNADPDVMRYFPGVLDRAASDASATRIRRFLDEHGWGLWAVEVRGGAPFIGFIGLQPPPFEAHFTPAVEVGWRLAKDQWGRGYAPEGAAAALDFAFGPPGRDGSGLDGSGLDGLGLDGLGLVGLGLDEVVSMTIGPNAPSRRVMQKLGMTRDPADDFDHPNLPDWELRRHLLYRITRAQWRAGLG